MCLSTGSFYLGLLVKGCQPGSSSAKLLFSPLQFEAMERTCYAQMSQIPHPLMILAGVGGSDGI